MLRCFCLACRPVWRTLQSLRRCCGLVLLRVGMEYVPRPSGALDWPCFARRKNCESRLHAASFFFTPHALHTQRVSFLKDSNIKSGRCLSISPVFPVYCRLRLCITRGRQSEAFQRPVIDIRERRKSWRNSKTNHWYSCRLHSRVNCPALTKHFHQDGLGRIRLPCIFEEIGHAFSQHFQVVSGLCCGELPCIAK